MTPKLRILLSVVAIAVPADQLCKFLVDSLLALGERVSIVDGFLYIAHARNPGAAFGLFGSTQSEIRMGAFVVFSLTAMAVIAAFYRRLAPGDRIQSLGLSLVLAGASGNFIDRLLRGEVVDFLHVRLWGGYAWPDFNLADVCIVMGVASLIVDLLSREAMSRALQD
jgi:signal peptidase II